MVRHGHEVSKRRHRTDHGYQHNPTYRRHAGSAHHVYPDDPDAKPCGETGYALRRGPPKAPLATKNEVAVTSTNRVLWNGAPVDLGVLRAYLDQSQTLDPIPELRIRPAADARYEQVDKVLAVIKRANVAKMGFVGNEAYANEF